ncbi:hypothetical protein ACB094_12G014700 [Castanea mollissima]
MGRSPCCSKVGMNRGAWSAEEDKILTDYIATNGEGKWRNLPKEAGLKRCGKSCRLRWINYLKPDIKRGNITSAEEDLIIRLHKLLGNRWALIAKRLPGRTDNEIKNYWNTVLKKKLSNKGKETSDDNKKIKPSVKSVPEVVKTKAFRFTKVFVAPQQDKHEAFDDNNNNVLQEPIYSENDNLEMELKSIDRQQLLPLVSFDEDNSSNFALNFSTEELLMFDNFETDIWNLCMFDDNMEGEANNGGANDLCSLLDEPLPFYEGNSEQMQWI